MTAHAASAGGGSGGADGVGAAGPGHVQHPSYVKIWGVLVALLVVSVLGPMLEIKLVTLVTAFGVAIVKAYLVAKHFMHLGVERRWVVYLLLTMVALMLVMVGGVAPDVMKHEGARWENRAAKEAVERGASPSAPGAPKP